MKKIYLAFMLFPSLILAQPLYNNGAKINVESGAYLNVSGNTHIESSNSSEGIINLEGIFIISGNITNNSNLSNGIDGDNATSELLLNSGATYHFSGTSDLPILLNDLTVSNNSTIDLDELSITVYGDATINNSSYEILIGNGTLSLLGNISYSGYYNFDGVGYLRLPITQSQDNTFQIGDGTTLYPVIINPNNQPTEPLGIRLNVNQTIESALVNPLNTWDFSGENNLDATITFRLEKSEIAPTTISETTVMRQKINGNYELINPNRVTFSDEGTYYLISITSVNQF